MHDFAVYTKTKPNKYLTREYELEINFIATNRADSAYSQPERLHDALNRNLIRTTMMVNKSLSIKLH